MYAEPHRCEDLGVACACPDHKTVRGTPRLLPACPQCHIVQARDADARTFAEGHVRIGDAQCTGRCAPPSGPFEAVVRGLLSNVAAYLRSQVAAYEGVGFALFLALKHDDPTAGVAYCSSAVRADVAATVDEFLARDRYECPTAVEKLGDRARILLEARCAELGRSLTTEATDAQVRAADHPGFPGAEFVLLLFDFGEGGNLAWFSTYRRETTRALELLRSWREGVRRAGIA